MTGSCSASGTQVDVELYTLDLAGADVLDEARTSLLDTCARGRCSVSGLWEQSSFGSSYSQGLRTAFCSEELLIDTKRDCRD